MCFIHAHTIIMWKKGQTTINERIHTQNMNHISNASMHHPVRKEHIFRGCLITACLSVCSAICMKLIVIGAATVVLVIVTIVLFGCCRFWNRPALFAFVLYTTFIFYSVNWHDWCTYVMSHARWILYTITSLTLTFIVDALSRSNICDCTMCTFAHQVRPRSLVHRVFWLLPRLYTCV